MSHYTIIKKRNRLILFLIVYGLIQLAFSFYYADSLPQPVKPENVHPENFLDALGVASKEIGKNIARGVKEFANYMLVTLGFIFLLFTAIQFFIKKIRLFILVLCPFAVVILGLAVYELLTSFTGMGTYGETRMLSYFFLAISMIIAAFLILRYFYRELFADKPVSISQLQRG